MERPVISVLAMALLWTNSAFALDYYVTETGAGSKDGRDWNNAFQGLPSTLVRGSTYYIADGIYPGYTFNTPIDGTKWVIIKKATIEEHGTDAGWQDSMGDGQAVFSGTIYIFRGYLEINGVKRNENNWRDIDSYGFRGNSIKGGTGISISNGVNNLYFKYLDIGSSLESVWPDALSYGVKMTLYDSSWNENIYFGYMHVHNVGLPFHSRGKNNITIEFSHIGPGFGKEAISHQYGHNWIIRNNKFIDGCVLPANEGCTAVIGVFNYCGTCDPNDVQSDNWDVYGNVFANSGDYSFVISDAVILASKTLNWKFYNNVIANFGYRLQVVSLGSAQAFNNLFAPIGLYDSSGDYSAPVWCGAGICQNSWCQLHPLPARSGLSCSKLKETWPTTIVSSFDPFIDWQNMDFRLKDPIILGTDSPVNAGVSLGAGFDPVDAYGNIRGADGYWDIGAYEYVSGTQPPQDTTPPVRSKGVPNGNLKAWTTYTTINLTTDEHATCRYSIVAGTAYGSAPNTFSSTGTARHSQVITGLENGQAHTYYVRCIDSSGNANTDDFIISFSVASAAACSPADTSGDGIVSITELAIYIGNWKSGTVTMTELMAAIREWKDGC